MYDFSVGHISGDSLIVVTSSREAYWRLDNTIVEQWLERELSTILGTNINLIVRFFNERTNEYGSSPNDFKSSPPQELDDIPF